MPFLHGKQLDTRVIFRLAVALSRSPPAQRNFLSTLFSASENLLFAQIAAGTVSDVTRAVAAAIFRENGNALFLPNARLTECIRQGEAQDALEHIRTAAAALGEFAD
jgi:hypothetical protein